MQACCGLLWELLTELNWLYKVWSQCCSTLVRYFQRVFKCFGLAWYAHFSASWRIWFSRTMTWVVLSFVCDLQLLSWESSRSSASAAAGDRAISVQLPVGTARKILFWGHGTKFDWVFFNLEQERMSSRVVVVAPAGGLGWTNILRSVSKFVFILQSMVQDLLIYSSNLCE